MANNTQGIHSIPWIIQLFFLHKETGWVGDMVCVKWFKSDWQIV